MTNNAYATVFPGQGSQSIGMMNELAESYPQVKACCDEASSVLNYDLWDIVCNGPEEKLNSTEITQPALLVAGVATWNIWSEKALNKPALLAGHSLGEYTALVNAGVMTFSDAVALVAERGRCMQQAVKAGEGAMAAILGLDDEQIVSLCDDISGEQLVSAANYNSPGQVVIAGNREAIDKAIEAAKAAGAKRAILLPVSVPSHCMLMKPAAEKFAESLNQVSFNDAEIPIVQNVDAVARTSATEIKPYLLEQLYKPVLWVEVIRSIQNNAITTIVECGPGKVLTGLNKRIDRSLELHCIHDQASLTKALERD